MYFTDKGGALICVDIHLAYQWSRYRLQIGNGLSESLEIYKDSLDRRDLS
ncbi:MAG: hypothetical protein RR744_08535 [Cellulosilyticaceae bacterium]